MQRLADCLIVPAGPGDAIDLARLHVDTWRETYAGILPWTYLKTMRPEVHARRWRKQLTVARPGEVVLVAEGPDGLIGYCAAEVRETRSELFTLYILPPAQKMGVGRRLMEAAARVLAAKGGRSLELAVLSENFAARGFYAHLGGVRVGERPVRGWGGGLMETRYRWADIGALASR